MNPKDRFINVTMKAGSAIFFGQPFAFGLTDEKVPRGK